MERPRRNLRLPVALSDYITVEEAEKRIFCLEEGIQQQQQQHVNEAPTDDKTTYHPADEKKPHLSLPYKCKECKTRYRSRVALLRHAVKHSGEKPFECCKCGRGLSSQCALTEHMNIHINNRPHRCEECGLESRQLSAHLRHLLTHQSHPSHLYKCSICSRIFKQNEYLKKHMRKHTGDKPYACEVCNKSFTCKSELNRHRKRHSSERPHSCHECSKTFKMKHNLYKHMRGHAGTQEWKCLLCSAVFSKLKMLEAHKKTHEETVQQLHMSRPEEGTLVISAEGNDRRRLPTVHTVTIPKECLSKFYSGTELTSKKHLHIYGTSLPLDLILKSVSKGSNIKVKIIDKLPHPRVQSCLSNENIVQLVDEETSDKTEGLTLSPLFVHQELSNSHKVTELQNQSVNEEAEKVESILNVPSNIQRHCLSKHYCQMDPMCPDYCSWLATFTSLCHQLCPPYQQEVCNHLNLISAALQHCLVQGIGNSSTNRSNKLSKVEDMGGSGSSISVSACNTHTQYHFIYNQYKIIQQVLNRQFTLFYNESA